MNIKMFKAFRKNYYIVSVFMKPEHLTKTSTFKRVATFRVSTKLYKFVSSHDTRIKGVGSFA